MTKKTLPYGNWPSPITAEAILESPPQIEEVIVDPISSKIYHLENRPSEGGRSVLVETEAGVDVVGKDWDVRSRVQEYGGGPATVYDGTVYFSNFADGRVYSIKDGKQPEAITPDTKVHRFARFAVHPKFPHLLVSVLEDHTKPAPADVVNTLCLINTHKKTVQTIVSGADFYAVPSFSPDGTRLAWEQWFHPDMPWEGSEIHIAKVSVSADGLSLSDSTKVAGKPKEISVGYPFWASNDLLVFTSDESGYQNPWKYSVSASKASPVLAAPKAEDFSGPMWTQGLQYGAALDTAGARAGFLATRDGRLVLYIITLASGALEEIPSQFVRSSVIARVTNDTVVFAANSAAEDVKVVICSLRDYSKPAFSTLGKTSAPKFGHPYVSVAQPKTVGPADEPVYLNYYPPTNPDYEGPKDELPPCVVSTHGGPTGMASQSLDWKKQYFTSRGFAYVDVNYGGSSGYGRKYIERLAGKWGIVDVQDSVTAIEELGKLRLVDAQRAAIRGESAGGYTTLALLCFRPNAVTAGCSLFGIADLNMLAGDTHKFESQYMYKLLGGTPEEAPELYKDRSPLFHADQVTAPLLILQGTLDQVVPPEQARAMVDAIQKRGGQVEAKFYEGEGHGFRREDSIKDALERELGWYQKVFSLTT